jgi:hypothetical protein
VRAIELEPERNDFGRKGLYKIAYLGPGSIRWRSIVDCDRLYEFGPDQKERWADPRDIEKMIAWRDAKGRQLFEEVLST